VLREAIEQLGAIAGVPFRDGASRFDFAKPEWAVSAIRK